MPRKPLLYLLLVLAVIATAYGQQSNTSDKQKPSQPQEEYVVKLGTTLVQIDAVVTDKNGRHVADLRPDEFEILQDGKPQKITNFSYIVSDHAKPAAPPAKVAKNEKKDKNAIEIPVAPAVLKKEDVRRTIAIIVTDGSRAMLSADNLPYVRKAIKRFVDEQMEPGDLVGIFRTRGFSGTLQQFTSNKQQLYAAIDKLAEGPSAATEGAEGDCAGPTGGKPCDFSQEYFAAGTLPVLEYIVGGMRNLPGRKTVLLISQDLRIDYQNPAMREYINRLVTTANRASAVINTLDPRGLMVLLGSGFSAASGPIGVQQAMNPGAMGPGSDISRIRMDHFSSQGGLSFLAQQTGGIFHHDNNDITAGVRNIIADQDGYYLIGYQPAEGTFEHGGNNAKFHRWTVRVTRPNLRVRTRSGFLGITDEDARPRLNTRNEQLSNALSSPFSAEDIPIRMTGVFGSDPAIGLEVNVIVHIDPRSLAFTDEEDGSHKATIDIVAITFGDNGRPMDQVVSTQTLVAKGEAYAQMLRDGLLATMTLPIKRPGPYQLRVAIRDVDTTKTGSASQFIVVPDINKGRLALSGIVAAGGTETGQQSAAGSPPSVTMNSEAGASVRRLRAGMTLNYAYHIYNARVDSPTGHPQLKVEIKLYKDDKEVLSSPATPLEVSKESELKRILAGGSIKLGNDLAPGEYILQIIVTDELIKEKNRSNRTSQWTTFEIVK